MFIKLSGNNIIGHDYYSHDEYTIEVSEQVLVNLDGNYFGIYKYKYVDNALVELTEEEMINHPVRLANLAAQARQQRDDKIKEVEWTLFSHSVASQSCKDAVNSYIAALRDVPEQEGFPKAISWPTKPLYVKE